MLTNVAAALQFGLRTFPVSIIVEEQLRLRTHALASPAGRSEAHVQVHFHRRRGAVAESQAIREHAGKVDASSEPGSVRGRLLGRALGGGQECSPHPAPGSDGHG